MPVRKRFKRTFKQVKDGFISLFKGKDQDNTRPNAPASTATPDANRPPVDEQIDQLGTDLPRMPPPAGIPINQVVEPHIKDTSGTDNGTKASARQATPPQEDCSPANMNIAVINTDGGALGSKVSTPAHLDTSEMRDPERVGEVSDSIEHDEIEGEPPVQTPLAVPTKWKALKLFAQVLAPATNIFGPIKETVGLFMECVDKHEMVGEAATEYKALRDRLEQLFEDLQTHFAEGGSLAVTYSIESLCKSIDAELTYIKTQQARNAGVLYLTLADEPDKILACYRRIEGHLQRLLLNANLSMWRIVQDQATNARSDRMSSLVDRLPSSLPAWYNSAEGLELKRRECTPGTRIVVLANLLGWARSGGGGVYWLNGMAGTGKTTIAYSVCADLDSRRQLGASFFCSRLREECRNVNLIIPSIAYQLHQGKTNGII